MIRAQALSLLAVFLVPSPVLAEEPKDESTLAEKAKVQVVKAADTISWPIGEGAEILYNASNNAEALIEREQVVPRMKKVLVRRFGAIGLYPTLNLRGFLPVPGLRMMANSGDFASSLYFSYGGQEAYETESRMRVVVDAGVPLALQIEGSHDRSLKGYSGLGQEPQRDPRNRFVGLDRGALYRSHRERAIFSSGFRPTEDGDVEFLFSTSLQQRTLDDPAGAKSGRLVDVLEKDSRPGSYATTRLSYTELAVRLDTREARGGPIPGFLTEVYGGVTVGVFRDDSHFARMGWMTAYFLDLGSHWLVAPRVTFDALAPLEGKVVPFEEIPTQPAFRAPGGRRDLFSAVASLDLRRRLSKRFAGRLFVDAARVGESVSDIQPKGSRLGGGFTLDIFAKGAEIGRLGASLSGEGYALILAIGSRAAFSDRQHRD